MPRTFTIFNHGTDFHRDKNAHEVVTMLSRAADGTEARIVQTGEASEENPLPYALETSDPSFLICEGPGSAEVTPEQAQKIGSVAHAHPGKYNPILGTRKDQTARVLNPALNEKKRRLFGLRKADYSFQESFMGNTVQPMQTSGRVLGRGWEDNVYKAAWLISHLKWEMNLDITTINIVGWSRGAVTALKMANKLYEVYDLEINVNIFAIDPVVGGATSATDDQKTLPPNVRNYLAILALDDDRANFQPTDKEVLKVARPKGSQKVRRPNTHFLPLPGNHSGMVITNEGIAMESALLCLHLAAKFLEYHGTAFKPETPYASFSLDKICTYYDNLRKLRPQIADKASSGLLSVVGGRREERHVRKHVGAYVVDPEVFINEHHRQCVLAPDIRSTILPHMIAAGTSYSPIQSVLCQMGIAYQGVLPR